MKFDIPAQPAPAALMAFAQQARAEVVFSADDLKTVKTPAVVGEMEPEEALALLLKDSVFEARRNSQGKFVVARKAATGVIKGALLDENGRVFPGVFVTLRETAQSATTNRQGEYVFPAVPAGLHTLVATAPGYQSLHIIRVPVHYGSEVMLSKERMHRPVGETMALEPFIVHAEPVTELDTFEVRGQKQKPFQTGNLDIPRSMNDAQPYYIFDAKTIERSGAMNIGEFLNQRLTMNTAAITYGSFSNTNFNQGNISSIDLRGFGADKTLILVNGRRLATSTDVVMTGMEQVDLNGIPLSAVERVEILPTSASGIYGASAMGGVVNVILKKDFQGGELRLGYDTPMDVNAARRQASLSYGFSLEGGRTRILVAASWSDEDPLQVGDRIAIYRDYANRVNTNAPQNATEPLGSLPNIHARGQLLTLKSAFGGGALGSGRTFVPAGTSNATSAATLGAGLRANAGQWNFDDPPTTQAPNGLHRQIGWPATVKSFRASLHRDMFPWLELSSEFNYADNASTTFFNPTGIWVILPAISPVSPFNEDVFMMVPMGDAPLATSETRTRSVVVSALMKLPAAWTGTLDYTYASNTSVREDLLRTNFASFQRGLRDGTINPFVDTLQHPIDLVKYRIRTRYQGDNDQHNIVAKASGPLPSLPWGRPYLTVGVERLMGRLPLRYYDQIPNLPGSSSLSLVTLPRDSINTAAYLEASVPLIKEDWLPGVYALELQASGREERFTVDGGTPYYTYTPGVTPPDIDYAPPRGPDGGPYFTKESYSANSHVLGIKYQPVKTVIIRASIATAFVPPTPEQLIENPTREPAASNLVDRKTGLPVSGAMVVSGGNSNLKPHNSQSENVGLIWTPAVPLLKGWRVNVEYYRTKQDDAITTLRVQQMIDLEREFPDRITRDASGRITEINASAINLFKRNSEGWDLSLDYVFDRALGRFQLRTVGTVVRRLESQYTAAGAITDAVGHHWSDGGVTKYKASASLDWERNRWVAGWSTRYVDSYKVFAIEGSPWAITNQFTLDSYLEQQGRDTISSQIWHDFYIGYSFETRERPAGEKWPTLRTGVLAGLSLQVGVKNIFDKAPALDSLGHLYESPYGDWRGRSIWLTLKKTF